MWPLNNIEYIILNGKSINEWTDDTQIDFGTSNGQDIVYDGWSGVHATTEIKDNAKLWFDQMSRAEDGKNIPRFNQCTRLHWFYHKMPKHIQNDTHI